MFKKSTLLDNPAYNPNNLLDALFQRLECKSDADLSRALKVMPPVISKIRNRRLPVGASFLIRAHDVSGLSIDELRTFMGVDKADSLE